MSSRQYVKGVSERFQGEHKLPVARVAELRAHLRQCDVPYLSCEACFALYTDIGYAEYQAEIRALVAEGVPNANPPV